MSHTIDMFMWGYQQHFATSLRVSSETIFSKLDPALQPHIFLVGFLEESRADRHPVCIEPDDCGYEPELFSSVKTRASELESQDPDRDIMHSHPIAEENHRVRLKRRALTNAVSEAIQSTDAERGVITFCSGPVILESYSVIVVLQLNNVAVNMHYSLRRKVKDRIQFQCSLIDATISEFLGLACEALKKPQPGANLDVINRDCDEIVRSAGKSLMYAASYSGGDFSGLHGLFDACTAISSLKYEGAESLGRMLVAKRDHPNINVELTLSEPVQIRDYRAVRKLLEMSSQDISLLTDSGAIYGLGNTKGAYDASAEDLFAIEFRKHHDWELMHDGHRLMRVIYGQPVPARTDIKKDYFTNLLSRIFQGISAVEVDRLWEIALEAIKQPHGTILVISESAHEEARRLKCQSTTIEPRGLCPDLVKRVTAIDGAVLVDRAGTCHAIGVILDGRASAKGTPSRGARYNSAVRYVEGHKGPCLAIVISADRTVDFVPDPMPQIERLQIETAIDTLRTLCSDTKFNMKTFSKTMDWLQRHRFYLLPRMCDDINRLRREVEMTRDRVINPSIKIVYQDFEPDADMNESYYL